MIKLKQLLKEVTNENELFYNGSRRDFNTWDMEKRSQAFNVSRLGFFFTSEKNSAIGYATRNGNIGWLLTVKLHLKKPLIIDAKNENLRNFVEILEKAKRSMRYDGAIITNVEDMDMHHKLVIVFHDVNLIQTISKEKVGTDA